MNVPSFNWNPAGCVSSSTWQPTTDLFSPLVPFISYSMQGNSLTIDTDGVILDPAVCGYCGNYVVKITMLPQPSNMLNAGTPFTTFNLKVY